MQGLVQVEQRGTQRFYSTSLKETINLLKELTYELEQNEEKKLKNSFKNVVREDEECNGK